MKRRQTYIFFLLYLHLGGLFILHPLSAQIANGTLYVTNQAQLDTLPYYAGITGHLIIGRLDTTKPQTNITDLSRFSHLQWIGGNLIIFRNGRLQNLHGLDALEEAGYTEITIEANDSLRTLQGLEQLQKVGEFVDFEIRFNPLLENLHGLEGIDSLNSNFYIVENARLKNLDGLNNIKYIDNFSLNGYTQATLESLHGLNQQVQITDFTITVPSLEDLSGLDIGNIQNSLYVSQCGIKDFTTTINSSLEEKSRFTLTIAYNPVLRSLAGLDLRTYRGFLQIHHNPLLRDITLDQVIFGEPWVHINDNPALQYLSFANMHLLKDFLLSNNDSLLVLDAFPVLDSIKGWKLFGTNGTDGEFGFNIQDNASLKSVQFPSLLSYGSLDMVYPYTGFDLNIVNNPQLERVTFAKLETILPKPGNFTQLYMTNNLHLHHLEMPRLVAINNGAISVRNSDLEALDSFDNLERGGIVFYVGPHLKVINTFEKLKQAHRVYINGDSLERLPDFLSLDTIGQSTVVYPEIQSGSGIRAPFMRKWPAFPTLTADYSFETRFMNNDSLQTTMTFPALKRIHNIFITDNVHLQSLDGFSALEKVTQGFTVKDNPQLTDCSAICDMLAAGILPSVFHLLNNPIECGTLTAVAAYCDTVSVTTTAPSVGKGADWLSSWSISPNPATYTVQISWDHALPADMALNWDLCNTQGQVLQQGICDTGSTNITVAAYTPGLYFLRLREPVSGVRMTRRLGIVSP